MAGCGDLCGACTALRPSPPAPPRPSPLLTRPPARSVLLDNALSAVDHHTAQHIFDTCFKGLFRDKATVLVTHQVRVLGWPAARPARLRRTPALLEHTPSCRPRQPPLTAPPHPRH